MDHIDDKNLTTFYELSNQITIPNFVKTASLNYDEIKSLTPTSFADPYLLKFPCHTKADTFLSYAYFLKSANDILPTKRAFIQNNLDKFSIIWNIEPEIERLKQEFNKAASEKIENLPDSKFAIVENWEGQKFRALPLLNSECVKKAVDHLTKYKDRYPASWRKRAAEKIYLAASKFNVDVPDYIKTAASKNPAKPTKIIKHILKRAYLVNRTHKGSLDQRGLLKVAKILSKFDNCTEKLAYQTMALLDAFDREHKVHKFYLDKFETPEEICWEPHIKKSANKETVSLLTGNIYKIKDLVKARIAPFRSLGQDFVAAIKSDLNEVDINKIAALVPTLPRPDAEILDKALELFDIKPINKQAQVKSKELLEI